MVRPPERLALTLPRSVLAPPSRSLHLQIEGENRSCSMSHRNKCARNGRLLAMPTPTDSLLCSRRYPVRQIEFPVSWRRELAQKALHSSVFWPGSGLRAARIARFPVKFPVCREFARRQVRSALRRQCGSRVRTTTFLLMITRHTLPEFHRQMLEIPRTLIGSV